ncbi:hypothetical protein F8388_004123 [Cannabis sativa]|uniref:Uncharacterized protein n=1 Tax=Cannabis sativa TaxID=3483 RepID=A0A7J6EBL4_CANSA|nr:hypothetical protein F8388_004123 [Cannabis sativa]
MAPIPNDSSSSSMVETSKQTLLPNSGTLPPNSLHFSKLLLLYHHHLQESPISFNQKFLPFLKIFTPQFSPLLKIFICHGNSRANVKEDKTQFDKL